MSISVSNSNLSTTSTVTDDWNGGYRLEVNISSNASIEDWNLNLEFPYDIKNAFGVELTDNGNGAYSISGINSGEDLSAGESTRAVFIIDDGGNDAVAPTFEVGSSSASPVAASPANTAPSASAPPLPIVQAPLALATAPLT